MGEMDVSEEVVLATLRLRRLFVDRGKATVFSRGSARTGDWFHFTKQVSA